MTEVGNAEQCKTQVNPYNLALPTTQENRGCSTHLKQKKRGESQPCFLTTK